jgi:uncharacterized membrane protein
MEVIVVVVILYGIGAIHAILNLLVLCSYAVSRLNSKRTDPSDIAERHWRWRMASSVQFAARIAQ